jgi:hypothetical protein
LIGSKLERRGMRFATSSTIRNTACSGLAAETKWKSVSPSGGGRSGICPALMA